MELRALGGTGIQVSPLGLGTVKIGRDQQVKYPTTFQIPDDKEVSYLLSLARELGINLIDTAPAYGTSQERLGRLLPGPRDQWVIISKVGESFENGKSVFDFGYDSCIQVVQQSLIDLRTDYIDSVLIHSNGDDLHILKQEGVLDALHTLKERGLIRSHGMSTKTVEGGLAVVEEMDIVMATCNLEDNSDLPVLVAAEKRHKGILIKKGLMSGHIRGEGFVSDSMGYIFSQPGVSSMIVGTISPEHLRANVQAMGAVLT